MMPIRNLPSRAAHARISTRNLQALSPQRPFLSHSLLHKRTSTPPHSQKIQSQITLNSRSEIRSYATKTTADEVIEKIQEQYGTAKDEFEIASEETEKKTVYAHDDRMAAREELNKLKDMFKETLEGPDCEEVKRRVGGRIRELDNAVEDMEKRALEE